MTASIVAFIGGVAAGAAIGAITRAIETSRIAFGPYALYGNGALAVPVILAPIALFIGWAPLMRASPSSGPARALYALGLVVGPALGYAAATGQAPSLFLLSFGLFTLPAAVLAALTISALRSHRLRSSRAAVPIAFVLGVLLAALPPLAFSGGIGVSGISVGAALVAGDRASLPAVLALGVAIALAALVQSFALPLLFVPR